MPIQGVHFEKRQILFKVPLIFVTPILELHIKLDQLEDEATTINNSCRQPHWSPLSLSLVLQSVHEKVTVLLE